MALGTSHRKGTLLLLFVIISTMVVHFLLFTHVSKHPDIMLMPVDSAEYLQAAKNLRNSATLYAGDLSDPIKPGLFSRRPLLYPLFIAGLQSLCTSHHIIILAQIFLMLLNGAIVYHIFTKIGIHPTARLLFTATYLLFPTQLIYTYAIMAEILLQTLLLAATLFVFYYFRTKRIRFLLLYNICISCALLTKPILLYFWLPNILFHLILFIANRKRLIILVLPLILVSTLLLSSYRNERHTGYFHYSSIKSYNLLHCNTYLFLMEIEGRKKADQFVRSVLKEVKKMGFEQANRTIEKRCIPIIRDNWLRYSIFQLRGSLFFFLDPGRFDLYHFLGKKQPVSSFITLSDSGIKGFIQYIRTIPPAVLTSLFIIMAINGILLLLFLVSIFYKSSFIRMKLFLLFLVAFFIVMVGPFGASRFRLAVFPILLLFIGMLFESSKGLSGRTFRGHLLG